jgi:hypothetical protein
MMKSNISIELYGHLGNNAIVRMPGRKNPGVVVQADTLAEFARRVRLIVKLASSSPAGEELVDEAASLTDEFDELIRKLNSALTGAGEKIA